MLAVFPFCTKDFGLALRLMEWIAELEPRMERHRAVLIAAHPVPDRDIATLLKLAAGTFNEAHAFKQLNADERGWPLSCNAMFKTAVEVIAEKYREPFFWCEPDCIPLRKGWLNEIQGEWMAAEKPFMGAISDKPWKHLSGIAVYPPDVGRVNPHMFNGSGHPWDIVRPELVLPHAHESKTIQHYWGNIEKNIAPTFPNKLSLLQINDTAAVFHRCKDGSLIERLRERDALNYHERSLSIRDALKVAGRKVAGLLRGGSSYYHSGNLGDIIYALNAIRLHGGGELVIGPEQRGTSPCAVPATKEQFEKLLPLLEAQRYLRKVSFVSSHPGRDVQFDLNQFRNHWNDWPLRMRLNIHNLCHMHCHVLGVAHKFDTDEPWLECGNQIWTNLIVIHRSARYHAPDFPWREIVRRCEGQMLFVGHEAEHASFQREFGCSLAFWKVRDFLELAQVIAGARFAVMNQSFPCSLALGLGVRVLQEACPGKDDCLFPRPGMFATQREGLGILDQWIQ